MATPTPASIPGGEKRKGDDDNMLLPTLVDSTGRNFTDEGRARAKDAFIAAYAEHGTIRAGCAAAHINRDTYRWWVAHDPVFAERLAGAKDDYNDSIQEEINRRAVKGVKKTRRVYFKGELVDMYTEIEYSDNLLMAQARARMPHLYRENSKGEDGNDRISMAMLNDILSRLGELDIEDVNDPQVSDGGDGFTPYVEPPPSTDIAVTIDGDYRFTDLQDAAQDLKD